MFAVRKRRLQPNLCLIEALHLAALMLPAHGAGHVLRQFAACTLPQLMAVLGPSGPGAQAYGAQAARVVDGAVHLAGVDLGALVGFQGLLVCLHAGEDHGVAVERTTPDRQQQAAQRQCSADDDPIHVRHPLGRFTLPL